MYNVNNITAPFTALKRIQLLLEHFFTGLHSKSIKKDLDSYVWSSGHKVSFTAWSDIEPDHYENERCVTMELKYGYRWATKSCDSLRSFICKSGKLLKVYTYNCSNS